MIGEWRSLVAHLLWEQRVAGSNPVSPTTFSPLGQVEDCPATAAIASNAAIGRH
jgi:hypothetical protein